MCSLLSHNVVMHNYSLLWTGGVFLPALHTLCPWNFVVTEKSRCWWMTNVQCAVNEFTKKNSQHKIVLLIMTSLQWYSSWVWQWEYFIYHWYFSINFRIMCWNESSSSVYPLPCSSGDGGVLWHAGVAGPGEGRYSGVGVAWLLWWQWTLSRVSGRCSKVPQR